MLTAHGRSSSPRDASETYTKASEALCGSSTHVLRLCQIIPNPVGVYVAALCARASTLGSFSLAHMCIARAMECRSSRQMHRCIPRCMVCTYRHWSKLQHLTRRRGARHPSPKYQLWLRWEYHSTVYSVSRVSLCVRFRCPFPPLTVHLGDGQT